jgi:hypothetical protein
MFIFTERQEMLGKGARDFLTAEYSRVPKEIGKVLG